MEQATGLTLKRRLRILGETDTTPEIDTASIDRALDRVRMLRNEMAAAEGGATTAPRVPVPEIDGARADGGPVSRDDTYLVGEEGPELVTPTRSGFVNTFGEIAQVVSALQQLPSGRLRSRSGRIDQRVPVASRNPVRSRCPPRVNAPADVDVPADIEAVEMPAPQVVNAGRRRCANASEMRWKSSRCRRLGSTRHVEVPAPRVNPPGTSRCPRRVEVPRLGSMRRRCARAPGQCARGRRSAAPRVNAPELEVPVRGSTRLKVEVRRPGTPPGRSRYQCRGPMRHGRHAHAPGQRASDVECARPRPTRSSGNGRCASAKPSVRRRARSM